MKSKSYKRELSVALLVWLVYVVETKSAAIVEILVWPIFTFAAAAFGFHSYATQLQQAKSSGTLGGRPECGSPDADREREYPSGSKPDNPERD